MSPLAKYPIQCQSDSFKVTRAAVVYNTPAPSWLHNNDEEAAVDELKWRCGFIKDACMHQQADDSSNKSGKKNDVCGKKNDSNMKGLMLSTSTRLVLHKFAICPSRSYIITFRRSSSLDWMLLSLFRGNTSLALKRLKS
jgi:hypothetical protein